MYRRILVGYDGSAAGRKAFEMALELAASTAPSCMSCSVADLRRSAMTSRPKR